MPAASGSPDRGDRSQVYPDETLPARIAAAVRAHPQVAQLDGGPFGTVASHLPGRRVLGVRLTDRGVQIAVIARLGPPLPQLGAELGTAVRAAVRGVLGPGSEGVDVEVTVSDVVPGLTPVPDPPAGTGTRPLT